MWNLVSKLAKLGNLRIERLWFLLPFAALLMGSFAWPLPLLDFWWHLKAGEVIVSTGSIPAVDQFSHTAAGQPFILQNWLGEVILYLVYRVGGYPLLVLLNTLLLTAALAFVYALCRTVTSDIRLAAFGGFLCAFCLRFFGNLRPQVFSVLLFAVFYWMLVRYDSGRSRSLWALPFLMAFWANLHGAFPYGLFLIFLFLVTAFCRRPQRPSEPGLNPPNWTSLGMVLLASILATLANPQGIWIWDYVRAVLSDPSSRLLVSEWQPPRIDVLKGFLLFYLPFFLLILGIIFSRARLTLTEGVLFLAFSCLGLSALRNGVWFGLIAAPITTRLLMGLPWDSLKQRLLPSVSRESHVPGASVRSSASRGLTPLVNWLFVGILVVLVLVRFPRIDSSASGDAKYASFLDPGTPIGLADYLEREPVPGPVFNSQNLGDYLIWRLGPEFKTFFDGRVHLFGKEVVDDYLRTFVDTCWEERLRKYNIRSLVLSKLDADSSALIGKARESAGWQLLYEDEVAVFFSKSAPSAMSGSVR